MAVTIGVDPHKGSHTAVALDEQETVLGQLRVRSGPDQLVRLSKWAEAWPGRTWAVENASGLGYLLSQQLVAAGERVVDVPPKLAARARLLDNGDLNKNDPNDARSVAVAALRAKRLSEVTKRGPCRSHEALGAAAQGAHELTYPGSQPPPCRHLGARAWWLCRRDMPAKWRACSRRSSPVVASLAPARSSPKSSWATYAASTSN